jgi:hypothetical protein
MRFLAGLVLAAMPLVLGGWSQSSETHMPWNLKGRAVVKTPDGVSHVIRGSVCNFGPRSGRLRFGADATDYLSIVVSRPKGKPAVLDIEDGILTLPNVSTAVLGTAQVQDLPVKRGTFVLYTHKGNNVRGKPRYTGSWKCG